MHNDPRNTADDFSGLVARDRFGPVEYDVSVPASDRYWQAAGIHHPARTAGFLYPPMAANLTMLAVQTVAFNPLLHTHQTLVCHQAVRAPATLTVSGSVTGRFERRGREYLEVTAEITAAGEPLWTSVATFTAAGESDPDPAPGRDQ
jgi:acyl-coenzyme A synthetase/AMP-(fatty) acid ligase